MNLGNRYSQHSFSQVPQANMARSKFDRSFPRKTTFDFDFVTPFFVDEVLPGDTINLNVRHFTRLAPQVKPLMDRMILDFFFFFVPNRLVWSNWEKLNGAQDNPGDSTSYLVPQIEAPAGGFLNSTIYDYMAVPTQVAGLKINALPLRMINLIYNTWFRDQNLQQSKTVPLTDGPDTHTLYTLFKRAKPHDYFTSALPNPQKGSASIQLPIGSSAPIKGFGLYSVGLGPTTYNVAAVDGTGPTTITGWGIEATSGTADATEAKMAVQQDPTNPGFPNMRADLSEATAATINQFRQAIMTQSFLELDARGGTRYVEILKSHFNVVSPDFRLQRPEFLSGGQSELQQNVVAQTSETATTPQGNLAAFTTAAENGNKIGFTKSFVEHGFVIGFQQARGEVSYQQGLNRMWSRRSRLDYFWPKFQELGEQAVLNQEIYAQGTADDILVFGYQERHAEYRYRPAEITGQFRSNFAQSLDIWNLAEEFGTLPSLNSTFIQANTPIERALVVTEGHPHILQDMWFDYKHIRPMVSYALPATLGRF